MSDVQIKRLNGDERTLPVFAELEKRLEAVRERAYGLFASRGRRAGSDLDDWMKAERELFGWTAGEMKERDGEYEVDVTLPGFKADEVELTATPNELIVHAQSKSEKKGGDDRVIWSEFGSSDVYRRFSLPTPVQAERISAELKNGVLKVHAPKSVAAKREATRIPVTVTSTEVHTVA
jgi:HSP20 family protein